MSGGVGAPGGGLELLTVGRVSVDLYSDAAGARYVDPQRFVKSVGGTATNVAVAAARLGRRAAVLTKVGADPFGEYVRVKLGELGVDTTHVGIEPALPTPLAFAALTPPEDPQLCFYRAPAAPDMQLRAGDVPDVAGCVAVLWVAGSAMGAEPARSTIAGLLAARGRRRHTVVDLDYRPALWPDRSTAAAVIGAAIDRATVVVGNRAECAVALGTAEPDAAADALIGRGVELAFVKCGADGVLVATRDDRSLVPAPRVEVVCGLGAGDAFGGALVHGLLAGWPPGRIAAYASAAGAVVAARLMCADAMPTDAEIAAHLEDRS